MIASGIQFKEGKAVALTLSSGDKAHAKTIASKLTQAGYSIVCTQGTHDELKKHGIESILAKKLQEGSPNLLDMLQAGEIGLMINTPGSRLENTVEAQRIRRGCIEAGVACITSIDTAVALCDALDIFQNPDLASCQPYTEYLGVT